MDSITQVLKKTNPGDLEKNVKAIEVLLEKDKGALKNFRAKQHLPFEVFEPDETDGNDGEVVEKPFLKCHYNEADNAYRSPWTNRYHKKTEGGDIVVFKTEEEKELRSVEVAANEVWEAYTQLYYGSTAVGSAFLRPREKKGSFEGIFGIHKTTEQGGSWNSVHVVQVDAPSEKAKTCDYRVESAVVCSITPQENTTISSSFTKETSQNCKIRLSGLTGSHLENLGLIMEQVEIDFRSKMERVDMPKTWEIVEQSVYRKLKSSASAYLMSGGGTTGMSVGAGLIDEIANLAKKRGTSGAGVGPNPFVEAMQKTLKEREAVPAPEFMDFRKNLKKTGKI